jgi:hypothetical protein
MPLRHLSLTWPSVNDFCVPFLVFFNVEDRGYFRRRFFLKLLADAQFLKNWWKCHAPTDTQCLSSASFLISYASQTIVTIMTGISNR